MTATPITGTPITGTPGTGTPTTEQILRGVLDRWKAGIDAHEPGSVAALFTENAIFQGFHPYVVGPEGVAEYYDSQPLGMTVAYEVLRTRRLADGLVLGFQRADFDFADRPRITVYLTLLLKQTADGWRIDHYQVSRLPGE